MRTKIDSKMQEKMRSLYDKGFNDPEISSFLGMKPATVYLWRKKNKLPAHATWGGEQPNRWKNKPKTLDEELNEKYGIEKEHDSESLCNNPDFIKKVIKGGVN
jgi:predicted DNA-binding transcriptional regulator AlpA